MRTARTPGIDHRTPTSVRRFISRMTRSSTPVPSSDRRSELRELDLEGPGAVAVGPSGIRCDHETRGLEVASFPHALPPPGDRGDREGGGVVVVADVHPPFVGPHIEDPVGDRLAHLWVREVVHLGAGRLAGGLHEPACLFGGGPAGAVARVVDLRVRCQ